MTERLYFHDAYQTTFGASVLACDQHADRWAVVLDRTAFYPTSGGQPFDVGVLADHPVLEVQDHDETIRHFMAAPIEVGTSAKGCVDWTRRFDHMQQHTGQHLLSAGFDRLFGVRTESFHLGSASATIDLSRTVTTDEVHAAEHEVNRVIGENRPVAVRFVAADEANSLGLRKESRRTGMLRLIEIQDFDRSACGGTHVATTGGVGVVVIAGWEKFRAGSRVEFLCGGRAVTRFGQWRDTLQAITRHLSVPLAELPPGIERLQGEVKALQKTVRVQQEALATHRATAMLARAESTGDRRLLVEAIDDADLATLKALATAITRQNIDIAVALFGGRVPAAAVIAAGSASGVDAAAVLKALIAKFGGKGGGKPDLAQAGGLQGQVEEILAHARRLLLL